MASEKTIARVVDELRRRYRTPGGLLAALGMDQSILEEREMSRTADRRRARDGDPVTAEEILDGLADAIINSAVEEHQEIVDAARELADGGHAGEWADGWLSGAQDRRRRAADRRLGRDMPPDFPNGQRPTPGGELTPAKVAAAAEDARRRRLGADARRHSLAMDARAQQSWAERNPRAAAVKDVWSA